MFEQQASDELNSYLDLLGSHLRLLPPSLRAEYREEIRQHLEDLAQNRVARGQSQIDALMETMKAFGDPKRVGKQIAAEVGWGDHLLPGNLLIATLSALIWLILLSALIIAIGLKLELYLTTGYYSEHVSPFLTYLRPVQIMLLFTLVPCFAVWLTGVIAPKASGAGILIAIILLATLTGIGNPGMPLRAMLLGGSVIWAVLGYLTATATSLRLRGLSWKSALQAQKRGHL